MSAHRSFLSSLSFTDKGRYGLDHHVRNGAGRHGLLAEPQATAPFQYKLAAQDPPEQSRKPGAPQTLGHRYPPHRERDSIAYRQSTPTDSVNRLALSAKKDTTKGHDR